MRWVSLLLALLFASCDSGVPSEPNLTPAVRLVGPLPDLDLDLSASGESVQLDDYFEGNAASGDLVFSLSVVSGGSSAVGVEGSVLSARPVTEGRSDIRVEARGAQGGVAADTFAVMVTDSTPAVQLSTRLPDFDLDLNGPDRSVLLASYFRGNAAAGSLVFTFSVIDNGGVGLDLEGATLSIRSVDEGRSEVRVEARGAQGGVAADTFTVIITDPCPAAPPPGTSVVLPVEVGQQWTYALSSFSATTGASFEYRTSGSVKVEVFRAGACAGGVQKFAVREERTELRESRLRNGSSEWVPASGGPTTTTQTYDWTLDDTQVTTSAPYLLGRPGAGLAPPPFGYQAPRYVQTSLLSPVGTVVVPNPGPFGPSVTLAVGVGSVAYRTTTLFGTAGNAGEEWTFVE